MNTQQPVVPAVTSSTSVDTPSSNEDSTVLIPETVNISSSNVVADVNPSLGEFKAYDSQIEVPEMENTRIVKCLYQINQKTKQKVKDSVYVRIPVAHITDEIVAERMNELAPFITSYLQSVEDQMIKDDHKAGLTQVYTDGLNLDKIISKLEELEIGNRLNKERIGVWFTDTIEEFLAIQFSTKLGINFDDLKEEDIINNPNFKKLTQILNAYKCKFESLASGKASVKPEDCEAMILVITSCDEKQSLIGKRFITRLESLKNKDQETLLSL